MKKNTNPPYLQFDPTQPCPMIIGIECQKEQCNFYNTVASCCIFTQKMIGHDGYKSPLNFNWSSNKYEVTINAGASYSFSMTRIFRSFLISVTQNCQLKFGTDRTHAANNPIISLNSLYGRVGTSIKLSDFYASYVILKNISGSSCWAYIEGVDG